MQLTCVKVAVISSFAFSDNMALQVVKLLREAYGRVKRLLKKVCLTTMGSAPA